MNRNRYNDVEVPGPDEDAQIEYTLNEHVTTLTLLT